MTYMTYLLNKSDKKRWLILLSIAVVTALSLWYAADVVDAQQDPPPRVGIDSQADVTEGQSAVFTVTAARAPLSDMTIPITVHEYPPQGSVAAIGQTGARSVTIPAGQTTAILNVGTDNDSTAEPRGMITAVIDTPTTTSGYRVDATAPYSTVVVSDDDNPVPQVSIRPWLSRVSEDGTQVTFKVTASPVPQDAITVNLNVAATGDYDVPTGAHTVVVPSTNNGTVLFSLPFINDRVNEPNGTVTATVQAGSDYAVGNPDSSTITVVDNDTPQVNISAGADVTEGEDATFTLTASPTPYQSLSVTVNISSSGVSGVNNGARTVSLPTSGSATFTIGTTDDSFHAPFGGWVTATVRDGSGYAVGRSSAARVDVADNDGPEVTITAGGDVTEGTDATFTLTATPPTSNGVTVNLAVAATGDFGVSTGNKTVFIPSSGSATYTVGTTDDSFDESDGTIEVTVKTGTGYRVGTPSSASLSVADDEATLSGNPVLTLAAGADINEGESASFTITATPPVPTGQTLDVNVGFDVPGLITLPTTFSMTGATHTFTRWSDENEFDEPDATLSAFLKPGTGYTLGDPYKASVTVSDNDLAKVRLYGPSGWIKENGAAKYTVAVNPVSYQDITVSVAVTATGEFGIPTGTRQLSLPAGSSGTSFFITPTPDLVHEPNGSVTVTVQPNSNIQIIPPGSKTLTIRDDDPSPGPRIQIDDPLDKAKAGGKLEFVITLNTPSEDTVSVDYKIGTLAWQLLPETDFYDDDDGISGTIEFAPGERQAVLDVHISPWAPVEHNDRIYVELENPVNGSIPLLQGFGLGRLTNR